MIARHHANYALGIKRAKHCDNRPWAGNKSAPVFKIHGEEAKRCSGRHCRCKAWYLNEWFDSTLHLLHLIILQRAQRKRASKVSREISRVRNRNKSRNIRTSGCGEDGATPSANTGNHASCAWCKVIKLTTDLFITTSFLTEKAFNPPKVFSFCANFGKSHCILY